MEKPWDMLQIKEKGMSMGEFDNLEERLMESLVSVKLSVKEILGRLQTAGENWKGIAHHWRSESDAQEKEIEMLRTLVIQMTETAAKLDPVRKDEYWQRLNDAGFYDWDDEGC